MDFISIKTYSDCLQSHTTESQFQMNVARMETSRQVLFTFMKQSPQICIAFSLLVEINFEIVRRVNNAQTNHCLFTLQQNASLLYIECHAKLTDQVYYFSFQKG